MAHLILILLLLLPSMSWGQDTHPLLLSRLSPAIVGGGVVAAGCTNPASGTTLGGSSTVNTSNAGFIGTANYGAWTNAGHTLTWSETCTTTTAAKVQVNGDVWDGGNCKAALYTGGSLVTNGVTNATSTSGWTGWNDLTFATPPTITKDATYKIVITCNTAYAFNVGYNDATGSVYTSATMYASPPSSLPAGTELYTGTIGIRVVK